ncbi:hypothetical protein AB1Y20_000467 [Prymnesium parvum]|uniref:Uncharacterized protein n=1 Tax=Prymnesium parvum TaxID=97485 RepID=A0AB34K814_PRYPA
MLPCAPLAPLDSAVEGCLPWCSNNYSALCERCKCRACPACRSQPRPRVLGGNGSKESDVRAQLGVTAFKAHLLLTLRGEAFREGGQHSRKWMHNTAPQLRALQSIKEHVLEPAWRRGWPTLVVADLATSAAHAGLLAEKLRGDLNAVAVRLRPLEATQLASIVRTLEWALLVTRQTWWGMVLMRADLEMKKDILFPPPSGQMCDILVPFQTLDGEGVCDTLFYIPWCRFVGFLEVLQFQSRGIPKDYLPLETEPVLLGELH